MCVQYIPTQRDQYAQESVCLPGDVKVVARVAQAAQTLHVRLVLGVTLQRRRLVVLPTAVRVIL